MDMSGMNMGSNSSSLMLSSEMAMVFFNSHQTPLYSIQWTPRTSGQYAGTCIFLIFLAIIGRVLITVKTTMEGRWKDQAWNRRYIVVAGKTPLSEKVERDPDAKQGVLTANGVEENVKVVHAAARGAQPWRFSVDLPRALLVTAMVGVGYLLMLAVMTLNVGYFCSILGGVFIGEMAVGRFNNQMEEHH